MGAFGDAFAQAYQAERERIARKALVKMQQDFQMKLAEKKFYDQLALMDTEHGYKVQEEQDKYKHQRDLTQLGIEGQKQIRNLESTNRLREIKAEGDVKHRLQQEAGEIQKQIVELQNQGKLNVVKQQQGHQLNILNLTQKFQSEESEKDRDFRERMLNKTQDFQKGLQVSNQYFQEKMQRFSHAFQKEMAVLQHSMQKQLEDIKQKNKKEIVKLGLDDKKLDRSLQLTLAKMSMAFKEKMQSVAHKYQKELLALHQKYKKENLENSFLQAITLEGIKQEDKKELFRMGAEEDRKKWDFYLTKDFLNASYSYALANLNHKFQKELQKLKNGFMMDYLKKQLSSKERLADKELKFREKEASKQRSHEFDILGTKESYARKSREEQFLHNLIYQQLSQAFKAKENALNRQVQVEITQNDLAVKRERVDLERAKLQHKEEKEKRLEKLAATQKYSSSINKILTDTNNTSLKLEKMVDELEGLVKLRQNYLKNPKYSAQIPLLDREILQKQVAIKSLSRAFENHVKEHLPRSVQSLANQAIQEGVKHWRAPFESFADLSLAKGPSAVAQHIANMYSRKYKKLFSRISKLNAQYRETFEGSSSRADADINVVPHDKWSHIAPKFESDEELNDPTLQEAKYLQIKKKLLKMGHTSSKINPFIDGNNYLGTGKSFIELMKLPVATRKKLIREGKKNLKKIFSPKERALLHRAATAYKKSLGYSISNIESTLSTTPLYNPGLHYPNTSLRFR